MTERHPYTVTPKGRWECVRCGVGIRRADCPHNRSLNADLPRSGDAPRPLANGRSDEGGAA